MSSFTRYFSLSLENPFLLPLLLLAFLPLLLHLLDRRRARVVEWPAMRLLVPRSPGRVRWLKRREAVLILLRSLVIVFIVLALLHPYSMRESAVVQRFPGSRDVALVVDTSASMAYRESPGAPSSLEKARDAALDILDGMSSRDRIAVWTSAGAMTGGGAPVTDLEAARRAVRDLSLSGGSFRLLTALDRVAEQLHGLSAESREVLILTDLQSNILPERDPARLRFIADRLRAGGALPSVRLIDCGSASPVNEWVASIEPSPLAAGTDEPTEVRATIEAVGSPRSAAAIPIRLLSDGVTVETASAVVPQGSGKVDVLFTHRFETSGSLQLSVEIPGDGLAEDDTRRIVLEVFDRIGVLLAGTSLTEDRAGTARYADLALAPRAGDLAAPPLIFRPSFAERIDAQSLADRRVVVLTGLSRLETEAAARIEAFVRGGGGLIIFAGAEVDAASLTESLFREGRGILPAGLAAGPRAAAADASELHPRDVLTKHPALSIFKDPEEGDLARVSIRSWTRVTRIASDAEVLARIDAESPWILERQAGPGRVILITTSAAPDDSDLPRTPLFLPLLHRLVRYVATRNATERSVGIGEPLSLPLATRAPAAELQVIDPHGKAVSVAPATEDGKPCLVFRDTAMPGFYEVRLPDTPGGGAPTSELFAVNVAPEESRVDRLPGDALADLRSAIGVEVTRNARDATSFVVTARVRDPRWPAAVAVAIALLFAEQLLASTFARGRSKWKRARAPGKD